MKKKLLAVIMALAMMMTLMPATAFAAGTTVSVKTEEDLKAAITNAQDGDIIKLEDDIVMDPLYAMDKGYTEKDKAPIAPAMIIDNDITLDLNQHTLSWDQEKIPAASASDTEQIWYTLCFFTVDNAVVTLDGNGTIDVDFGMNNSYGINIMNNGSVTVKNGTYTGATSAIQVQTGVLTVLDGTFKQAATIESAAPNYAKYVINCIDSNYTNGTARIYLKGGTYCYDFSNNPEGAGTSYIPADYEIKNSGNTWTVSAKGDITVDTSNNAGTVNTTVGGEKIDISKDNIDAQGSTLTIDAKTNTTATAANVTVGGDAMNTIKNDNTYTDVAITTDVGTLTVSEEALTTIVENATTGETTTDVTLSIKNKTQVGDSGTTYELNAKDAAGNEVFAKDENTDNGTITVSVPKPTGITGDSVYVYYLGPDGAEKIESAKVDGDNIIWDVTHFSTYYITTEAQKISVIVDGGSTTVYDDFAAAVTAILNGSDDDITIQLMEDITFTATIQLNQNKAITLDLNGKTATFDGDTSQYAIELSNNAKLTIDDSQTGGKLISEDYRVIKVGDGTISTSASAPASLVLNGGTITSNKVTYDNANKETDHGAIAIYANNSSDHSDGKAVACTVEVNAATVNGGIYIFGQGAKLTVNEGANITSEGYAISGNGSIGAYNCGDTEIIINGGTITQTSGTPSQINTAIYHPQVGTLTINGGTITSDNTAIEIRAGELTVEKGAVIEGGDGDPVNNPNGNGPTTTTNTGIAIAQHTTKQPITVNINGGTITAGAAVYESNPQGNSGDSAVTVNMQDATLNGDVKASGFGTIAMDNVQVKGNVDKSGSGSMGIVDSTITGTAPAADAAGVTYVNTTVNGTLTNTTPDEDAVALVGSKTYTDLQTAVNDAKSGDTVTLLQDVTLDGSGKVNNKGLLLINSKDITLNGNGKTITAENVMANADTAAGPSMINIQGGANVTVKNLTIDGAGTNNTVSTDNTKHGLNIYQSTVTVENVTIKNGNGYAIVANGSTATINGLTTSNNGWGGINVDSKTAAAKLTINSANISEANSVKMENGSASANSDPEVAIKGGTFQYITKGTEIAVPDLTISGGKFATGTGPADAVTVNDYLAPGLAIDGNGNVYTPSSGGGSGSTTYSTTVEKTENGTVTVSPQNASKGSTVTITIKPNEGFALDKLTVTDKDGKEIELTKKNDTQYTFTMPASKVTVKATFAAVSTLPFTDVDADDWYYEAVKYAYDNDLMNGMGNNRFAPNTTLSRGMIAQVLYNLEKNPAAGSGSFTDVTSGAWYADAVNWAAANDIVNGYSDGTFAPNKDITRQEMATILYRYAQYKGYDTSAKGDLSVFTDGAKTGDWAKDAMVWAVGTGLLEGHAGAVNPTGTATRAEVATILMRFCENVAK